MEESTDRNALTTSTDAPSLSMDEALDCPLCGYDLRGLTSARCPECGHAFDVDAIRQSKLDRAEWVFETAQRRLFVAFLRTSARALLPLSKAGFWWRLPVSTPVVMPRLRRFATLWLGVLVANSLLVVLAIATLSYFAANSTTAGAAPWTPRGPQLRTWGLSQYTFSDALGHALRIRNGPLIESIVFMWPLLVFGAINLFGITLKRAGIHSGHLWRVALYTLPLMVVTVSVIQVVLLITGDLKFRDSVGFEVVGLAIVTLLHLIGAHMDYLRLPQAIIQAILIWIVGWLSILAILQFFVS